MYYYLKGKKYHDSSVLRSNRDTFFQKKCFDGNSAVLTITFRMLSKQIVIIKLVTSRCLDEKYHDSLYYWANDDTSCLCKRSALNLTGD